MKFLNGYKSKIGVALGALAFLLHAFGVATPEQATGIGALAGMVLGGGIIHKFTKGHDLMKQVLEAVKDSAMFLLALGVGAALVFGPMPAAAGLFSDGSLDLKVLKLGKEVSLDLGFGGVGFRVFPSNSTVIDLEPVYVDPLLGACKLWGSAPWCQLLAFGEE